MCIYIYVYIYVYICIYIYIYLYTQNVNTYTDRHTVYINTHRQIHPCMRAATYPSGTAL